MNIFRKEILGSAALSLLALTACDPMSDIYKQLDEINKDAMNGGESTVVKEFDYTLTSTDYSTASKAALALATTAADTTAAKAIATQLAFNETFTAPQFVPTLLRSNFPGLGNGSTITVTSNSVTVAPELVQSLTGIATYTLTADEYPGDNDYFTPAAPVAASMPGILKAAMPEAESGDIVLASYRYSEIAMPSDIFFDDFDQSGHANYDYFPTEGDGWFAAYFVTAIDGLTPKNYSWQYRTNTYGDNLLGAQFSSYNSNEIDNAWLITPAIDLTGVSKPELSFGFKISNNVVGHKPLTVKVSTDFAGDVASATWVDITSTFANDVNPNVNTDYASGNSGVASLANFSGKTIRIAFIYDGNSAVTESHPIKGTTTLMIDDVKVAPASEGTTTAPIETLYSLYKYNGSAWASLSYGYLDADATSTTTIYAVQPDDYSAMGNTNKYFSSSVAPANYLPQLLAQQHPYAQVGNQIVVVYQYGSATTNQAALYTVNDSRVWAPENTLTAESGQYICTGTAWVFDPTITFTMAKTDYQYIVDWVYDNLGEKWLDQRYLSKKNAEMWCGASSYYGNMDFTISLRRGESADPDGTLTGKTDEECYAIFHERIVNDGLPAVLKGRYPDAPALTSGVEQYYQVIYYTYPEKIYYMAKYKGLGNGQFEFVEGPIQQ